MGRHRGQEGSRRSRLRPGHRGRQGRPHRRHRPAWLPAGVARRASSGPRPRPLHRRDRALQDHRTRQEPQQRGPVPPRLPGREPEGDPRPVPQQPQGGRGPRRHDFLGRQLRRIRRPRRHGRTHSRQRTVVEARRPSGIGRHGRRPGQGAGARRRLQPRAHQLVAEGHPAGSVAGICREPPGRAARLRPGHQVGAVRCVRPGRRGHRGPRAHLGDVGPPCRQPRAGRHPR